VSTSFGTTWDLIGPELAVGPRSRDRTVEREATLYQVTAAEP
jgi:hypothetical protein